MVYKITFNNIKELVSESVKRILSERMNVVDEKMFLLAEDIYNKILKEFNKNNYTIEIKLSKTFIKKYYPYNNPQDLTILAEFDNSNGTMEYLKNKTILINLSKIFNNDKNTIIGDIVHELTHYVNDCEGNINDVYKTDKVTLDELLYLLRDTECNARCSCFGYLLFKENNKKDIEKYEEITKLNKINKLLTLYKNSTLNIKYVKILTYKFEKYKQKIYKIYSYYFNN